MQKGLYVKSSNKYKFRYKITYVFAISLHLKDLAVLQNIQKTLGVGKIVTLREDAVQFRVESLENLSVIIDHFNRYPLQTKKQLDFKLFKLALTYLKNKEHLTSEGLKILIAIKASMNKGLTDELKALFPDITPMIKPKPETGLTIDP